MRTIVHIGPLNLELPAQFGGAIERRMVELASAQAGAPGTRVVVYSRGDRTDTGTHNGVVIRYWKTGAGRVRRRITALHGLAADVALWNPTIVHLHGRPDVGWLLRHNGLSAPTVLSCDYHREPLHYIPIIRAATRLAWRRCRDAVDVIAPVSEYCARIHSGYWGLAAKPYATIPNGVDLERFRPDPDAGQRWRARAGLPDVPVLLYVGRLCHQKGTDLLIDAFRRLKANGMRASLLLVGPADKFGNSGGNRWVQEVQDAGGIYRKPVLDADLPGIYNLCDVFVMPTRDAEMFGMAAVEAQACGKPVVASDHGGLSETVPGSAGLRFRNGDAGDLAHNLGLLLRQPCLRLQLSTGAVQSARRFSWPHIAARCDEVYSGLLASARKPA